MSRCTSDGKEGREVFGHQASRHSGLSMYRNPNLQGVAACQNLESGKTAVSYYIDEILPSVI